MEFTWGERFFHIFDFQRALIHMQETPAGLLHQNFDKTDKLSDIELRSPISGRQLWWWSRPKIPGSRAGLLQQEGKYKIPKLCHQSIPCSVFFNRLIFQRKECSAVNEQMPFEKGHSCWRWLTPGWQNLAAFHWEQKWQWKFSSSAYLQFLRQLRRFCA